MTKTIASNSSIESADWVRKENEKRPAREAAFKLVTPETNWKGRIRAEVPAEVSLDAIADAVIYFTGTAPTFTPVLLRETNCTRLTGWRVEADGYTAGPCGDH